MMKPSDADAKEKFEKLFEKISKVNIYAWKGMFE
jgi:hypothetical protein